jgi:sec-independent protein translocase protein TatA
MGALRPWHIAILVGVLILLFGAKKLPDAARSLGRSMRILKAETKGLAEDNKDKDKDGLADKADAQVTEQKPLQDNQASPTPKVDPIR